MQNNFCIHCLDDRKAIESGKDEMKCLYVNIIHIEAKPNWI